MSLSTDSPAGLPHENATLTAAGLRAAYRAGRCTPVEVTEHCLAAAAATRSVFICLTPDRARREAAQSAARWKAGHPLGAMDGIPISWKDLFDVAGTPTTAASALLAGSPPAAFDCAVVARASAAGMLCLGKTNLSEFAYSGLGIDSAFGIPVNPGLGPAPRVPGGSSSGAAIAVARGIGAIAMGTDTAGSVRVPAAFNGLTSFRASTGRYPMTGLFPLARSLDTLGPIAHSLGDCAAMDAVLRDEEIDTDRAPDRLHGRRFVVDPDLLDDERVHACVRDNLLHGLERLRCEGATIERRRIATLHDVEALIKSHGWLGAYEAFALHRRRLDDPRLAERIDRRTRRRLETVRQLPQENYQILLDQRARLIRQFADELGDATLVLPTVAHPPPLLAPLAQDDDLFASTNLATLRLTMLGSFLDTPAAVLPSGFARNEDGSSGHLPTSLQLMRPRGTDEELLRVGLAAEHALQTCFMR